MAKQHDNFKNKDELYDVFAQNMILIAIFSIEDPIREGMYEIIEKLKGASLNLKVVTHSNMHFAKSLALRLGIVTKE